MTAETILLADDDTEDKSIIQDAMEILHAGHVMNFAVNGQHALELLQKNYENNCIPCLIVLDLNMPKLNGAQTLASIKSDNRFKDIPVIIYSTSINPLEKEKCMSLGAYAYITKPVSFKESIETAKTLLGFCSSKKLLQD